MKIPAIALLLVSTACMAPEDTDVGSETEATAAAGVTGAILARTSIANTEMEFESEGMVNKIEADEAGETITLVLQDLNFAPGGHTGWHTHAGPAIVQITSGVLTVYRDTDPCNGRDYAAGSTFIDGPGFGVHIAKNNTASNVNVKAVLTLPTPTSPFRIDAPAPAGAADCGL